MVILIFLSAISGVIVAAGVFMPWLWFFSILGLVPFAYVLDSGSARSTKAVFALGLIFGIFSSGTTFIWFWAALPFDWIGLSSIARGIALMTFSWLCVILTMGFFSGLFAVLFVRLKTSTWKDPLLAASLWTLSQYLQMWGFAALTIAPASLFGAHFSAAMLGYALAWFSPLLQLASLGGIYLLTFVAAFLGFSVYRIVCNEKDIRWMRFVCVAALLCALTVVDRAYPLVRSNVPPGSRTTRVALVSTNFAHEARSPQARNAAALDTLKAVQTWAKTHPPPDILIFPEAADVFRVSGVDPSSLRHTAFNDAPIAIIDSGAFGDTATKRTVRMFAYDTNSALVATYDKMFFVPQGEYTPLLGMLAMRVFGGPDFAQKVEAYRSFKHGDSVTVASIASTRVGSLFCTEVISPRLYRDLVRGGAELFVNASSHAFFHGSSLVDTHILAISKVRAVENGRYLVTAGNAVRSSVISDRGTILARSSGERASVLEAQVPRLQRLTPYTYAGDLVILIPLLAIPVFALRARNAATG